MKKFENNSDKQRKLYDLINSWFDYSELEIIEESLLEYYKNEFEKENDQVMQILEAQIIGKNNPFNNLSIDVHVDILHSDSSNEEIKDRKEKFTSELKKIYGDKLNKILFKTHCLFIVNFSIQWEKKIKEILILCGFIEEDEEEEIGYRKISKLIDKNFKILSESEIYKHINNMREIANKIKHNILDDKNIISNFSDELIDIFFYSIDKNKIFKFENDFMFKTITNNEENNIINERCEIDKIDISGDKEWIRKYMKDENKIDIGYIIKNFRLNINDDWILKEFSFNKKEGNWIQTKYSINPTFSITFSEEEREKELKK